MTPGERIALGRGQLGKAQLQIATHDQAPLTGQRVREAAHGAARGERRPVRQPAQKPQTAEAEPERPVHWLPIAIKGAAFTGHGAAL